MTADAADGFDSGYAVAVYVALSAVVTIVAAGTYNETRYRDLTADPTVDAVTRTRR